MVFRGDALRWCRLLLSAQYQVPQWLLWLLLALGTTIWGLAKWMERQEAKTERSHDRAH